MTEGEEFDRAMAKTGKLIALLIVWVVSALLLLRVIVPWIWENVPAGPIFASLTAALGIVGLSYGVVLGRNILFPRKKPAPKTERPEQ